MSAAVVLYINHVANMSGAEESLLELASKLDNEVFRPVIACPPGELALRAKDMGIETRSLPLTRFTRTSNPIKKSAYAFAWVAGTNHLRKIIASTRPTLIHANSATAQLYAAGPAEKSDIPSVWHSRDLRDLPLRARALCRKSDRVIAVSNAVADFLAASGLSRPKVTRIYNGIDAEAWRDRLTDKDIRAELGLPESARILLMAAQFVPWKRHEDAIRALPHILETVPEAALVFAGNDRFNAHPDLKANLEALAVSLGVRDSIVFAGYRKDMPDLMNAADVVVMPSDSEPFGRVAIEAMVLSKPVVGTRAGGLPEIVRDGETGLLVVPRFPESLATACVRLLENHALAQSLGQAGRVRTERLFDADRIARETQTLYEEMLHPPLKWVGA